MVKRDGSESLAVDVCDQLRNDIFNRRFSPGERLRPTALGERFGVSLSVTREALGLLAAQSLVRIERNRGFHVTTLSPAVLADLSFTRKINEGAALRLSIEQGGVNWESEVLAAHHRLASGDMYAAHDPTTRNNDWAAAHLAFHSTLIEACGNGVLLDVCQRLSDAAELYRAWSGRNTEVHRDIPGEHKALLGAALAHDADRAVALFEAHVDRTAAIVMDLESRTGRTLRRRRRTSLSAGGSEGRID